MSKLQTILEDMSAGIHASFGDNQHKYCEQHIANARKAIEELIASEKAQASADTRNIIKMSSTFTFKDGTKMTKVKEVTNE